MISAAFFNSFSFGIKERIALVEQDKKNVLRRMRYKKCDITKDGLTEK